MNPYQISREELAVMLAGHTCGIKDAIPEQDDYDLADKVLAFIENELRY